MAEDREILREVWDGRIPICFRIAVDEVYTLQHPEPFYVMVPRLSYFPIVTDKVQKHFSTHVREEHQNSEMWLEYDGQPLKWHYPVGLLFDFYGADSSLPWNLTVHFQNFPEEELIHCPSRTAVQSHFMATVKEASALKHRTQLVQSMHPKDHKELWQGIMNDKFDQFWAVNKKLMENPGEACFKYIPFRLYQSNKPLIQNLTRPVHESGEKMTLYNLLENMLPHVVQDIVDSKLKLVTHGIEPSLDTPLQWMSEHLSYPDNFLHLVLLPVY